MTRDRFWQIIEQARAREPRGWFRRGRRDPEKLAAALASELRKLDDAEVLGFDNHFRAVMREAFTWRQWGAAYLIEGGCGDDGFEYWRCGLIAQGRAVFERAVADPDSLADLSPPRSDDRDSWGNYESVLYVGTEEIERRGLTRHETPGTPGSTGPEPRGERWEEEDLSRILPRLARKYGG